MKFSQLKPRLESAYILCKPGKPTWWLHFNCPCCGTSLSVAISDRLPENHTWMIKPDPLVAMGSIHTGEDVLKQWERIWDTVTLQPSIQNAPHPRQIPCAAHFTVTDGDVVER